MRVKHSSPELNKSIIFLHVFVILLLCLSCLLLEFGFNISKEVQSSKIYMFFFINRVLRAMFSFSFLFISPQKWTAKA